MKRYKLSFSGRRAGAIGITSLFSIEVEAPDPKTAALKAYDTHDHIIGMIVQEVGSNRSDTLEALNVCEHGDHAAPAGKRFCSKACADCEAAPSAVGEDCAGICQRGKEGV